MNEKLNLKTRTVGGRKMTLVAGERYMAARPFANGWRRDFPVTIYQGLNLFAVYKIEGLTYDEANAFLRAFNNRRYGFEGRVW